jgi:peptidoglycan/LPS O-acetylase OafA/YrhL
MTQVAERMNTPAHIATLDGVRAVAAYGVIATHVGFNSGRSLDDGPFAPALARLDFGVTLFFLLSGFLLFRPFTAAAIADTPGPRIGSFWWRRALRILPAYWLVIAITLALLTTRSVSGHEWRSYLLLTQTYNSGNVDPSLTQMWTLAVEISFYAALPILAVLTRRLSRRGEFNGQLVLLAAMAGGALLANVLAHSLSGDASVQLLWLPANLDWFALGMLLAVASCAPATVAWVTTLRQWASVPGTCWLVGALLFWLSTLPLAGPRNLLPTSAWEWTIKHYLYGAAAFAFMLPVVLGSARWLHQLLGNPVARWLGSISYGVYLWHLALLIAIQRGLGWKSFSGHFFELYVLTALAATGAAAASWYLLERPLLRRFSRPWRPGRRRTGEDDGNRDQANALDAGAAGQGRS